MPVENRRRALATVFLVVSVDLLGFGIHIPVIPLYAQSFGASEFVAAGLLFAPVVALLVWRYDEHPAHAATAPSARPPE